VAVEPMGEREEVLGDVVRNAGECSSARRCSLVRFGFSGGAAIGKSPRRSGRGKFNEAGFRLSC
jgi:hypothetical protein